MADVQYVYDALKRRVAPATVASTVVYVSAGQQGATMSGRYTALLSLAKHILRGVVCALLFFLVFIAGNNVGLGAGSAMEFGFAYWSDFEHGWPLVYLERTVYNESSAVWHLWHGDIRQVSVRGLASNVGFFVLVVLLLFPDAARAIFRTDVLARWVSRLSIALVSLAVVGDFGWRAYVCYTETRIARMLEEAGHGIEYDYGGPLLLRRLGLDSYLPPSASWVVHRVTSRHASTIDVEALGRLRHVKYLFLDDAPLTDEELRTLLQSRLRSSVEVFVMPRVPLNDRTGQLLEGWRSLHSLDLEGTDVSDDTIRHLTQLRRLSYLDVSNTQVTSESYSSLNEMRALEVVGVIECDLDEEYVEQLRARGIRVITE